MIDRVELKAVVKPFDREVLRRVPVSFSEGFLERERPAEAR